MPSPGTSHKDYESVGRVLEPCGYAQSPLPPRKWSVVIDGCKITPRVVRKTLLECYKAKADLRYVARRLGVGIAAVLEYLRSERSIPKWIAERFYLLFSSSERLPLAPPTQDTWSDLPEYDEDEDGWKYKPIKFRSPDFDARALGKVLVAEREKRGWTRDDAAARIHSTAGSIRPAEDGQVKWVTNRYCLIYRLCDLYGVDVRAYELKPRIDYKLFQEKIITAKARRDIRQQQIVNSTGISGFLLRTYLNPKVKRNEPVYLEEEMRDVMTVLGIDPESVILKGDVRNENDAQRDERR